MELSKVLPSHPADLVLSSPLDAAITAYRAAEKIARDFDQDVFTPAHDAWEAAVKAVPHYTTTSSYVSQGGLVIHLSTERSIDVAVAKSFTTKPYGTDSDDFVRTVSELVKACEAREEQLRQMMVQYQIRELEDQYSKLQNDADSYFFLVEQCPVFTIAEMIRKAEFLDEQGEPYPRNEVLADLRRIAGGEV